MGKLPSPENLAQDFVNLLDERDSKTIQSEVKRIGSIQRKYKPKEWGLYISKVKELEASRL